MTEQSKGRQGVVQLITDMSGKDGLQRWRVLREFEFHGVTYMIPLPDDTLNNQLVFMTNWCKEFARDFNLPPQVAELIALAYVARQLDISSGEIQACNVLHNNQTGDTQQHEADNLILIAETMLSGDVAANKAFRHVAHELTGNPRNRTVHALANKYRELLDQARAHFYAATGIAAVMWTREKCGEWSAANCPTSLPEEHRGEFAAAARDTALTLAANALGNNIEKCTAKYQRMWRNILTNDELEIVLKKARYDASVVKVRAARKPTCVRPKTTPAAGATDASPAPGGTGKSA